MAKDDIFHALKAIVATQRDYGRRDDRKFSRLKYLVDEWGIDKFRSVVEQYLGKKLEPLRCDGPPLNSLATCIALMASRTGSGITTAFLIDSMACRAHLRVIQCPL